MTEPMRLSVFGWICGYGASMALSFFQMVDAWLEAGHEVDLYSPGTFVDAHTLVRWPRFRYLPHRISPWREASRLVPSRGLPRLARTGVEWATNEAQRILHFPEIASAIRNEHRARPYDAFVALNILNDFDLARDLPVISFAQGSPDGESEFLRREGALARRELGWSGWGALLAAYAVKDRLAIQSCARSTCIVSPSAWTRGVFQRAGIADDRLEVLAPPLDLSSFRPTRRPANPDEFRFVWLGRIVPRKRLPLALEAFELLRARRPGVRFTIVGGLGYGQLLRHYEVPPLGPGVEWLKQVPHDQIAGLLARSDVLLQPSENENFGTAVVEALAAGLPSVLGPTNGTADVTGDAAFLFERYEPAAVADAMERAMDAVLAEPAGIAARARAVAEKNLELHTVAARAADLVASVADRWRSERGVTGWRPARASAPPRSTRTNAPAGS
ncbi:MAG TPA: glycosyltransferase family 4 protein [Polyangiaceae bacterium]|jgi:glycosyltransferase involved in cell wall biosynthesis